MKILQIIDTLNVGGAERVFVDMCNILYENDINVAALFLLEQGVLGNNLNLKIPKIELKRFNKWSVFKMYKCSKVLREHDIIHCHCRHVYKYIRLVDLLFFTSKKIIFQDHYGSINIDKKPPLLFNSILKPSYYIGVSAVLTTWAKESLNIKDKFIFLLQNIIVKNNLVNISPNKTFDFILVSNIKLIKNQLFAVKLSNSFNKNILVVGQIHDVNYYQQLLKEKTDNIEFSHQINEVQTILNNAKIGLHTSKSETGPLVLIEYLAQGLPFLAYETGEVASVLKPYFPEYFIDNFDENNWIERINILLNEKPDIEKLNMVFEKHFGKQQYFDKLNDIYRCIKN